MFTCSPAEQTKPSLYRFNTEILTIQAFLLNEDLGDSLDSVEALVKKHEDFEKSLSAQEEKITVSCLLSLYTTPGFSLKSKKGLISSRHWMSLPPS